MQRAKLSRSPGALFRCERDGGWRGIGVALSWKPGLGSDAFSPDRRLQGTLDSIIGIQRGQLFNSLAESACAMWGSTGVVDNSVAIKVRDRYRPNADARHCRKGLFLRRYKSRMQNRRFDRDIRDMELGSHDDDIGPPRPERYSLGRLGGSSVANRMAALHTSGAAGSPGGNMADAFPLLGCACPGIARFPGASATGNFLGRRFADEKRRLHRQ